MNKQWALAAAWNSGNGGAIANGSQQVGVDWHPCRDFSARLTYDRTTLGFLTSMGKVAHPYLSTSICVEGDVHGRTAENANCPYRFGAKLTFKN